MARRRTEAPDAGARDAAAKQLADAEAAVAAALTAKHDANIAAQAAAIETLNAPLAGVTVKGNQGR
jgi:hypothetical protein